ESTGLVTRFTIDTVRNTRFRKSALVKLLSQADLVKVIADGYLCDLNTWDYTIDREKVFKTFAELKPLCQPTESAEFTRDDVYDIRDYLDILEKYHGTKQLVRDLKSINFWDVLADTAPYLDYQNRAQVLHFIWGENDFFTNLFNSLSLGLKRLNFAREVAVDFQTALVPRELSIIDVERWGEILMSEAELSAKYTSKGITLPPNPTQIEVELESNQVIQMNRSVLSGLGAELTLHLPSEVAQDPQRQFLLEADCLDFPGARNRLGIDERRLKAETEKQLQAFLRGKVSYLFNLYDLNLEISTFLLCLNDVQLDNSSIVKLAYNWIRNNVGSNAEQRERLESKIRRISSVQGIDYFSPFMVVFTFFNRTLVKQPNSDVPGNPGSYAQRWISRLYANFADYFTKLKSSDDDWVNAWNHSEGSFKNAFFLRDPIYSGEIYSGNYAISKTEEGIKAEYQQTMLDTEQSFLNNEHVLKLVRKPQEAWNETTQPNKPGSEYIVKYLTPTAQPTLKYEQVKDLLLRLKTDIKKHLDTEFEGDDQAERLKKARINAAKVRARLATQQATKQSFGIFLETLMLPEKSAWSLYYNLVNSPAQQMVSAKTNQHINGNGRISLYSFAANLGLQTIGQESANELLQKLGQYLQLGVEDVIPILESENVEWQQAQVIKAKDLADIFSENFLYESWGKWLNDARRSLTISQSGVDTDTFDIITEHLRKNMDKVQLAERLSNTLRDEINGYHPTDNQNFSLVAKVATATLNEYIRTAGDATIAFEKQPLKPSTNKKLLDVESKTTEQPIFQSWQTGFSNSSEAYALGKYANAEQLFAQEQLKRIIDKLPTDSTH
ncbi:virulence factor SrfC family protein, partial [Runella sp.]|uniref:virulence factor SrfC family protein n=1 Tax=Runella sp. TaxID=1960881 RepID=UPI003016147C